MFLIAGLGNPERKYEGTRHNIGFDVIDALAMQYHIAVREKKHRALCGTGVIEGVKVILAKPMTYMNLSGDSVAEIVNFYKLDPETELLVIFDDISLSPGNIRVRKKGSAGGHNGIKSIIRELGTQNFLRIKVGVGERENGRDLASHVLSRMGRADRERVEAAIRDAVSAAALMVHGQADKAMNDYNAKKQEND
ncbi:MAG: aminoacyl-tRNA hydrolase [Blautia sp.]|nr:aminoacyl-tRNA hydrolase [Blautia sp.]